MLPAQARLRQVIHRRFRIHRSLGQTRLMACRELRDTMQYEDGTLKKKGRQREQP
jgi:hypothetical protein